MKWEHIQSKWQEFKGQVKQRWGKLTDQDLLVIDGKRDVLAGKLLERSTNTKEQIEKEISAFEASCASCDDSAGHGSLGDKPAKAAAEPAHAKPSGVKPVATAGTRAKSK